MSMHVFDNTSTAVLFYDAQYMFRTNHNGTVTVNEHTRDEHTHSFCAHYHCADPRATDYNLIDHYDYIAPELRHSIRDGGKISMMVRTVLLSKDAIAARMHEDSAGAGDVTFTLAAYKVAGSADPKMLDGVNCVITVHRVSNCKWLLHTVQWSFPVWIGRAIRDYVTDDYAIIGRTFGYASRDLCDLMLHFTLEHVRMNMDTRVCIDDGSTHTNATTTVVTWSAFAEYECGSDDYRVHVPLRHQLVPEFHTDDCIKCTLDVTFGMQKLTKVLLTCDLVCLCDVRASLTVALTPATVPAGSADAMFKFAGTMAPESVTIRVSDMLACEFMKQIGKIYEQFA